uniref:uncharacterized protein LOC122584885 n=1 Tax=Erigeron canadensis TaxID=72917 RepID=UPI001CB91DF0|nr:uncharacterized protein LOC122584885 [Erigeron canadensis]
MTCFGIHYKVAGNSLLRQPEYRRTIPRSNRLDSITFHNLAGKSTVPNLSTSATGTATGIIVSDRGGLSPAECTVNGEDYKFDEWIQNSVTEIVKNIRQAPLLVQIYADGGVVKTETAVTAAEWPEIVRNTPDGIILVEEIQEDVEEGSGSKEFGVLIQGKIKGGGRDNINRCKSACYLLKTSSVKNSGIGGGNFCTHFCLMKVSSFGKSVSSQFNECWLLQ